jgi:acetylornithine deacetylase
MPLRDRPRVDPATIRAHVDGHAADAFAFLERLVAADSTVGNEQAAQDVVADELERLGFEVSRLPIRPGIAEVPGSGVPQTAYEGRFDVLGSAGSSTPAVLLNGHVDVVPAGEPTLWSSPPFEPRRDGDWLIGRGAGDMKGGFAMAALAVEALTEAAGELPDVAFLSVIEEECTGNGTLSAALDGVLGRVVVLPEPTDLRLLLAGVGIAWFDLEATGSAGHAESADRSSNPLDVLIAVREELRALEQAMNAEPEAAMDGVAHPYNVNVGIVEGGDWPSSVPASARMRIRVGHPTPWTTADVARRVDETVRRAIATTGADATRVALRASGFRAEGYTLPRDHRLVRDLAEAHAKVHGPEPATTAMGSTTDARIYLNRFDRPAVCYGPRTRNIHGVDEAVDLRSIVDGAKTLAMFLTAAALEESS